MALSIKRTTGTRATKCVLHRVADIPGGVAVVSANLGGSELLEGTPLGKGENGLYRVCKTARIIAKAQASATQYEISKGSHFVVGDHFAASDCNGKVITAIDKSHSDKDVITLASSLGKAIKANTCAYESEGENTNIKVKPIAVASLSEEVKQGENLWVSAVVIGVVSEAIAPAISAEMKLSLWGVVYV